MTVVGSQLRLFRNIFGNIHDRNILKTVALLLIQHKIINTNARYIDTLTFYGPEPGLHDLTSLYYSAVCFYVHSNFHIEDLFRILVASPIVNIVPVVDLPDIKGHIYTSYI